MTRPLDPGLTVEQIDAMAAKLLCSKKATVDPSWATGVANLADALKRELQSSEGPQEPTAFNPRRGMRVRLRSRPYDVTVLSVHTYRGEPKYGRAPGGLVVDIFLQVRRGHERNRHRSNDPSYRTLRLQTWRKWIKGSRLLETDADVSAHEGYVPRRGGRSDGESDG